MNNSFLQSDEFKNSVNLQSAPKQATPAPSSWLDQVEQLNSGYTPEPVLKPESVAEQLAGMPNSDKLSPTERWLYERLPGFAEKTPVKALMNFLSGPAGKVLSVLDVFAEGIERTLGLVAQYRDKDPEEQLRLKDAWAAGSLFYDTARLPRVQYDKNGKATGIRMDTDMPGAYAVTEARRLMEQGKSLEEVRELLYNNLGALSMRSQLQDTLGHVAGDPLTWMLGAVKPVQRLHAIRNLALAGKMDPSIVQALHKAALAEGRLEDAAKFADALKVAEQNGKALTRLDKFAIMITGGTPYLGKAEDGTMVLRNIEDLSKGAKWWATKNPFALRPEARAQELLDMITTNVGEHLIRRHWDSPEDFVKAVGAAARGSIGNEWGHLASTIQGRTTQAFLSQADSQMRVLGLEWATYAGERRLLDVVSSATGKNVRQLWLLAKQNPEQLYKHILSASQQPGMEFLAKELQAGRLTPDIATQIGKIDNSIPLVKEEFFAKARVLVEDGAMRQALLQFGIHEKGAFTKWMDALKGWETIPFIRANPANAIRNLVNNDVTLVGRGLFGTMTSGQIDELWKGRWIPPQFTRGFSISGDTVLEGAKTGADKFDAGSAVQQMIDVLEGKGTMATKFKDAAHNIDLKAFDFSKFSARHEAKASKRAATNGWLEFHQKYWNSRTGFTSVSKSLDSATLQQMEDAIPGISNMLDDIAQASRGDPKKFAELMQTNIEHNVTSIFKKASDSLGYKADEVLGPEVTHMIEEGLPKAIQEGTVPQFLDNVRFQMESHVDDMFAKHVENLPGIVAAQVQAGGPLQFHRIFGKAADELWGGQIEHSRRMSTINELMDYARQTGDYTKVGSLWNKIQVDGENHFRRIWSKFDAYQKGLQEGATQAGLKYPAEVADSFANIRKGWEEFFDFRNSSYREIFDQGETFSKKTLEGLQAEITTRMKAMTLEEDKLYQSIDDLMAKQLPDPVQRKMYMNWRDQAAQLRIADKEKTIEFFERIRKAKPDQTEAMWAKYWAEKQARLEQMRQLDAKGSAAMQGDSASTAPFFGDVDPNAPAPQNIFELATRYDIASASKGGVRNDRRILSTVNKYAKETSATDVQIVQNAKLPEGVKTAFAQWDEAKQAVKAAQKSSDDPLVRADAVKVAKEAEKAARQAYNDALQTNRIDSGMVDKLIKERTFMDTENIPLNVAQEAFEARRAAKTSQAVGASKDYGFMPDAEKMFPDPMPIETGLSELNYGRSFAAMDSIGEAALATTSKKSRLLTELPEELQKKVMNWARQVEDESGSFRAAGVQYASFRRDSALLNYNRRTNFDNWVGHMAPFAFWSTHSIFNWAIHSLDRPAMLSSYFRARQFFETAGLPDQNVPQRLKNNIRLPLPFAPEWMGDAFINPMRMALPFDGFMMPWEQAHQNKQGEGFKIEKTLEQMLERGMITEDQYQEALREKGGDAWETAKAQVDEGGDNYDAMDFISMTMTPHAPLMWAYNAMRGQKNDIGPFTPMSRTARNVATMMGVDDWSNSPYNIEGRIRKSMGLPAYDKWDDYRVGRMISNIAADGNHDMAKVKEAMEIAALVEAGKMTSEEAVKTNELYKLATKRANVEAAGGWLGTATSLLGMPVRYFPEGEQRQRNLADEFGRAYQAYDKGDPEALAKFFDEFPEYESRLALFKSPEERIKAFMVDNIWSKYNSLPQVQKNEIREQLGDKFTTYFLQKETQSYDALTPEQLNIYLKLIGGRTVGRLSTTEETLAEFNQLKLTDPETAWRVETFYAMRKEDFPNWHTLQNGYYELPEGSVARNKFKNNNPALTEYWDARRRWMEQNPDLVRFLTDDEKQLKRYERMQRNPAVAVPTLQEIRSQMSPEMVELLQGSGGQTLPPDLQRYLDSLAAQYGNISSRELLGMLAGP